MSLSTPPLRRNVPFRTVNQPKGNPFLSLRAIPFLIVLAGSLAIQPAVGASPVVKTIQVSGPGGVGGLSLTRFGRLFMSLMPSTIGSPSLIRSRIRSLLSYLRLTRQLDSAFLRMATHFM